MRGRVSRGAGYRRVVRALVAGLVVAGAVAVAGIEAGAGIAPVPAPHAGSVTRVASVADQAGALTSTLGLLEHAVSLGATGAADTGRELLVWVGPSVDPDAIQRGVDRAVARARSDEVLGATRAPLESRRPPAPHARQVAYRPTPVSAQALRRFTDRLFAAAGPGSASVGFDGLRGQVRATSSLPGDAVLAAARAEGLAEADLRIESGGYTELAGTREADAVPYTPGAKVRFRVGYHDRMCTLGPTLYARPGGLPGTRAGAKRWMLTARHCGDAMTRVYVDKGDVHEEVGRVAGTRSGSRDAGMIEADPIAVPAEEVVRHCAIVSLACVPRLVPVTRYKLRFEPQVYTGPYYSGSERPVLGKTASPAVGDGVNYCVSGATSGAVCRYRVAEVGAQATIGRQPISDLVKFESMFPRARQMVRGDSGAPVYVEYGTGVQMAAMAVSGDMPVTAGEPDTFYAHSIDTALDEVNWTRRRDHEVELDWILFLQAP